MAVDISTARSSIAEIYIAAFNRVPDTSGLDFWVDSYVNRGVSLNQISQYFTNSTEYMTTYPTFLTNDQYIAKIYLNVFGRAADAAGQAFWVGKLTSGQLTNGTVMQAMLDAAHANGSTDGVRLTNEGTFGVYCATNNIAPTAAATQLLTITSDPATVTAAEAAVIAQSGQTYTLTNGTDVHTASDFESGLVYNPAGTDRINALQSEDILTGAAGSPAVLNAVLGNANDNGAKSITPTLNNIQTINLQITGDTNTLDVRFADSLDTLSINKITAEATNTVSINNIGQPAANLTVKDSASVGNTVNFNYIDNVLPGTTAGGSAETGNVTLSSTNMTKLHVGNVANTQGFETLNLAVSKINQIKSLEAIDLENLKVTGTGTLSIVNTTQQTDRVQLNGGGIAIGDGLGIRTIDLSGFNTAADPLSTVAIDITAALGGHADPANSGQKYFATITGSAGADTFWTSAPLAVDSATLKDTLNGGTGTDTLKLVNADIKRVGEVVGKTDLTKAIASVTNVENLNVLLQTGGADTVNLAAFDSALATVVLRNEQSTGAAASVAGDFTLREVNATIANGGISLMHASGAGATGQGTPTAVVDTVNIRMADATGTKDTVSLTVKTDLNTSSTYDYAIKLETEFDAVGARKGWVENLTINDNDNETNTVTAITGNDSKGNLTALGLTGTITLTGGTAGKGYTVTPVLSSTTVDASTQLSNLKLRVGDPLDVNNYGTTVLAQTIKLGSGDDVLTFDGKNFLTSTDTITDAGGTDTVRAWYAKDGGTPVLTGIEKFQLMATANSTIDLSKATGITQLALLSDQAVETIAHNTAATLHTPIFTTAPVAGGTNITTSVITLQNSNLSEVNFFGDTITKLADGSSTQTVQYFNGLTLANNAATALTVNINASLDPGTAANPSNGVTAYNLGQLTAHGTTSITINVANELTDITTPAALLVKESTTSIANIWAKDATSLTVKAAESNVSLGTVTGNATNNSLKVFDASGVGGNVTATVISLGDAAVVTLSTLGDDVFSANGSSGKLININGGNGNNTITGSAQSDFITTGTGNDIIVGGRGDNVITSGTGNDSVTGGDGNNTFNIGAGTFETALANVSTANDASKATNVFAGTGTLGLIQVDVAGNAVAAGDVNHMFAVGSGADLTLSFTGATLNAASSTLNGRLVDTGATLVTNAVNVAGGFTVTGGNTYTVTDSNSHLVYSTGAMTTFVGAGAADSVYALADVAYSIQTGGGNDSIVVGGAVATAGAITAGTGADKIALGYAVTGVAGAAAHTGAITLNFNAGDSSAANAGADVDTVAGFVNALDIIHFNSAALSVGTQAVAAAAGVATISAAGIATFNVADTTLAQHITAAAAALGSSAAGGSVVWAETGANGQAHSYLYITDGFAGASSNDVLVELVGTAAVGAGITIAGGNITAIA